VPPTLSARRPGGEIGHFFGVGKRCSLSRHLGSAKKMAPITATKAMAIFWLMGGVWRISRGKTGRGGLTDGGGGG